MIFGRFKITGHSMQPTFYPGDQVIAFKFSKIKAGDVVVFKRNSKNVIKRVVKISEGKYFLAGDNKNDSLSIPPIQKRDIIGKVILKI